MNDIVMKTPHELISCQANDGMNDIIVQILRADYGINDIVVKILQTSAVLVRRCLEQSIGYTTLLSHGV